MTLMNVVNANMNDKWIFVSRTLAVLLMALTILVSVPLSIRTYREGGGPWGFGIIGLHVLLPLNSYVIFSIAAFIRNQQYQWRVFIAAHVLSIVLGLLGILIFPIVPKMMLFAPALMAAVCIIDRKNFLKYLVILLLLAIAANLVLLKWEMDFDRTIPLIDLFQSVPSHEQR